MLRDDENDTIVIDSYYPCIKYKSPAYPEHDGTDYFILAESMSLTDIDPVDDWYNCSLSFTCENDQKTFYKLKKDCLRFRIHGESFNDFLKHSWFSLLLNIHYG